METWGFAGYSAKTMAKTNSIETLVLEAASLWAETREIGSAAYNHGKSIRDLGTIIFESMFELRSDADSEALALHATRLLASAEHAVTLALELTVLAGRLQQLADIHRADVSQ